MLSSAARLIFGLKRFDHITPVLMELHWLPNPQRITYKLCMIKFNPRTAKLFQSKFAAKGGGGLQPPWILVFMTEFLRGIFHGYSFGVKKSKGDS